MSDEIGTMQMILPGQAVNVLVDTRYGRMLVNQHDVYVGASFVTCGEFSEGEVALFRDILGAGDVVLDIGANIGAHTVPLAQIVGPTGHVFAFEPQLYQFHLLCANLALNDLFTVEAHRLALGRASGMIQVQRMNPHVRQNFGGLSLGGGNGDHVSMIPLDAVQLPRLDFVKIDVEGMELDVLLGACLTIEKHQPVLYVEADRQEQRRPLLAYLHSIGYAVWEHLPTLWNDANWTGATECPWPEGKGCVSINWLCLPEGIEILDCIAPLPEVYNLRLVEAP